MLKTLTKYDYRELVCKELRNWRIQGKGCDSFDSDLEPCALGIARMSLGTSKVQGCNLTGDEHPYMQIYIKLGLEKDEGNEIWRMNDDGKTFEEIAAWLEAQP